MYLQKSNNVTVLTDIEMPGMNGLSFVEMFNEKMHIITSSTQTDYAIHAREMGCEDFLAKPFTKQLFDKSIENIVNMNKSSVFVQS